MTMSEADTRAKLIDPKLFGSGWKEGMIEREKQITKGMVINESGDRLPIRKPDYILYYPEKSGIPLAVIEAEAEDKSHLAGMQQAKEYRKRLGVSIAYSTNGKKIEEYDHVNNKQTTMDNFPTPADLWGRYVENKELKEVIEEEGKDPLTYPYYPFPDKPIRYYQEVAVKNAIEAISKGEKKVLLTMATGSGKTYVAFQIAWKLWKTGKIKRVLFVVDRIFLRGQAYRNFQPFRNARVELIGTEDTQKHKDIFFATYQTLYSEKDGKRFYEFFEPAFFDIVIIDECHRSGWKRWHDILKHFSGAIHLGMTATPKRDDNIDTYAYFGEPTYDYPMRQGIEDGYLAPCEIIRAFTNIDKSGVLSIAEVRSQGAKVEVPENVKLKKYYSVEEIEREITLPDRTKRICEHITKILESTGPKSKTAIFCVSQNHAAEVTKELNNHFGPKFKVSNYAVRIVADEPYAHEDLKLFGNSEKDYPVVVTTVDLLSTGVDIPPVRNIVFLQSIKSKVVFHQIIGRGTRIDEPTKKFMFRIIDYMDATRLFDKWDLPDIGKEQKGPSDWHLACKIIDGETGLGIRNASVVVIAAPSKPIHVKTNKDGSVLLTDMPRKRVTIDVTAKGYKRKETKVPTFPSTDQFAAVTLERDVRERKELVTVKNVSVYIAEEGILKINVLGDVLDEAEYIEYCKDGLVKKIVSLEQLKEIWKDRDKRINFKEELEKAGVDLSLLSKFLKRPDAEEFDLIAHILFKAPIITRSERASALLMQKELFEKLNPNASEVIFELVDRYKSYGIDEAMHPRIFRTPPFDKMGFLRGVAKMFGGLKELKKAIGQLEAGLYPEFSGSGA